MAELTESPDDATSAYCAPEQQANCCEPSASFPTGRPVEEVRATRDEIAERVEALVEELDRG